MHDTSSLARFYIVVRADLPSPGLQAAQSVHAAIEFQLLHPELIAPWHADSNFLVIVAAPGEGALMDLATAAHQAGIAWHAVREPDCNDEITALALEPGSIARRLCAELPLALKGAAMAA